MELDFGDYVTWIDVEGVQQYGEVKGFKELDNKIYVIIKKGIKILIELEKIKKYQPEEEPFTVAYICKNDLRDIYKNDSDMLEKIEKLSKEDMQSIARELEDWHVNTIDFDTLFKTIICKMSV